MSIERNYKILTLTTKFMYNIIFCGLVIDGFDYSLFKSTTRGSAYKNLNSLL